MKSCNFPFHGWIWKVSCGVKLVRGTYTDKSLSYRRYRESLYGNNKWSKITEPQNWAYQGQGKAEGMWVGKDSETMVGGSKHSGSGCGVGTPYA